MLQGLLNRDPNQRFGTEQVKNHPFFAKIDWEKLERKEITPPWKPPNAMNIDSEVLSVRSGLFIRRYLNINELINLL